MIPAPRIRKNINERDMASFQNSNRISTTSVFWTMKTATSANTTMLITNL